MKKNIFCKNEGGGGGAPIILKVEFTLQYKSKHLSCPYLYGKGVQILIFIKNENVNTYTKIWTARFAFKKNENVNKDFCTTCLDLRFKKK